MFFWHQASFGRAESRFIKNTLHIESATCRLTGAEWAHQYHAGPRIWTDTYICKDSHGEQESGLSNGFHLDHVQATSRETHSETWTETKESPPPNLRRRHVRIRSQEQKVFHRLIYSLQNNLSKWLLYYILACFWLNCLFVMAEFAIPRFFFYQN